MRNTFFFTLQILLVSTVLFAPSYGAYKGRTTGAVQVQDCSVINILGQEVELYAEVSCGQKHRTYLVWKQYTSSWETMKQTRRINCQFTEWSQPRIFGLFGSNKVWIPELPCKDTPISWPQERDFGLVKKFE